MQRERRLFLIELTRPFYDHDKIATGCRLAEPDPASVKKLMDPDPTREKKPGYDPQEKIRAGSFIK